jgi:CheY-like chemotaxis protein
MCCVEEGNGKDEVTPMQPLCILILEDDWLVRTVVAEHLRAQGHVIVEAASGEEGVALLPKEPVDVLFTDIKLAGRLTGWDVADVFREKLPQIPVIYASGRPPDESRKVPGSVFFEKPYIPDDILQAAKRLVT